MPYATLLARAAAFVPRERLVTDALRLAAWGSDASFYRLVPRLAVVVESEAEVVRLLALAAELGTPVTFRGSGTSLSGQAVSDSVLVLLGDGWRGARPSADGATIALQPGVIGAAANRALAPFGRRIGPDPASIDAATIGGIAANNASGMCCGTAHNSYRTLEGLRVVLADGGVLDTRDAASRAMFIASRPELLGGLAALARETRADARLAARIRDKYRLKNTTGYSLNALLDFDDPIDMLAHLMIGSEGTLGFISEITYRTVPEHRHKASAFILFERLEEACRAVTLLAGSPVDAVELADRAALRSVEGAPGLPATLAALGPRGAALLVETRAADAGTLARQVAAIEGVLAGVAAIDPPRFSTEAAECARYWKVRKGMFPSVGAMRRAGTTVVIEDVAFPVPRLAEATHDLQHLLDVHGYREAIIFGHALAGNLHFVFAQDFGSAAEVGRYRLFMDALCRLVVDKYDGSLKAEHGTGRNIAPFVEREWGAAAHALMRRIKRLLDPLGLLNPGVILNDDPEAHLRDLKPLPATHPMVDKCIECGFCEPQCPSRGLTLSPRQRIAAAREMHRGELAPGAAFDYFAIDTCAGCGLCQGACPVGIDTGAWIRLLRGQRAGRAAKRAATAVANRFGVATAGVRAGLAAADALHGVVGTSNMAAVTGAVREATGGRVPRWSPALPRPARFSLARADAASGDPLVYFPSCAARTMGAQRGDDAAPLPLAAERVFRRAGFAPIQPRGLAGLCCGQPFESKGFAAAAARKAAELEAALYAASHGGRFPVVFDTSPCAYRMQRFCEGRLAIHDVVEFLHDRVLDRLALVPLDAAVAIHPVCSVRKMGTGEKLAAIAARCAARVVTVPEVSCCGFAGDKGFTRPELNAHALRHLRPALPAGCLAGYSSSRTCEVGLSERSGIPYRSIVHLVDAASASRS